jgi:hypothetical protein
MKKQFIILFALTMILFSSKNAFSQIEACYDWHAFVDGYSLVLRDDQQLLVSGIAGTDITVLDFTPFFCDHDFNAWVYSELANSSQVLSFGRAESTGWEVDGRHLTFNAEYRLYCVTSAHGFVDRWTYDDGKIFRVFTDEYLAGYSRSCYTFSPPPPPTPTPTPPCFTCQDIQATIGALEIIEKYNVLNVPITVSNATETNGQQLTTTFSIRTSNGTGSATFEDGTTSISFQGDVQNQNLRIKGVTESSQVDNIIIEAKFTNPSNNTTRTLASDNFTVAVITALEFGANNSPIDANPGTGQPNTNIGQRIYPDKDTPTDTIDRQSVKVIATVLPATLNTNVYFGTFDLDDPSTSTVIDPQGATGNDNNGTVTNGTNAGLLSGTNCTATANRLDCPISNGTSESLLTVTMQPGDNFAVVASLTPDYRNGIVLDTNNGARIIDANNNELPIARTTGNEVVGIRTQMLTVWRRLHIEVDSMGLVRENYVRGNVSGSYGIAAGATRNINVTAPNLETNRFENGRIELAYITNFFDVVSNTSNTVTIKNATSNSIVIDSGVNFQILNQGSTRSGLGTITTGQTVASGDTVTINVNSRVPLENNLFANGSLFITPTLNSLTVLSNTATSLEVRNNSRRRVSIDDATFFRLYDDDDMNDDAPPILGGGKTVDGDEGDDVPDPDLSLLQDSDLPANNVFAPAYIRPQCCLQGSRVNTPFILNLPMSVDVTQVPPIPSEVQTAFKFENAIHSDKADFWAIYMSGAYQLDTRWDGDPQGAVVLGIVDSLSTSGQGGLLFLETTRTTELGNSWNTGARSRRHTVAHEIGHKFGAIHSDFGLMEQTSTRTIGTFEDITINRIRKIRNP